MSRAGQLGVHGPHLYRGTATRRLPDSTGSVSVEPWETR